MKKVNHCQNQNSSNDNTKKKLHKINTTKKQRNKDHTNTTILDKLYSIIESYKTDNKITTKVEGGKKNRKIKENFGRLMKNPILPNCGKALLNPYYVENEIKKLKINENGTNLQVQNNGSFFDQSVLTFKELRKIQKQNLEKSQQKKQQLRKIGLGLDSIQFVSAGTINFNQNNDPRKRSFEATHTNKTPSNNKKKITSFLSLKKN
ncbi:hypothetical protein M0812_09242 [Anaeramoeba flamelloides]|uniref:Uncharacterized protein n=1 Tax=Anaeramoeba flamelloides TaxID=1746091 RepID=A0AAV7ZSP7_9EUKA|nr:hypothetical protein M0812_09242 [Anaeramoeba flamelloides]